MVVDPQCWIGAHNDMMSVVSCGVKVSKTVYKVVRSARRKACAVFLYAGEVLVLMWQHCCMLQGPDVPVLLQIRFSWLQQLVALLQGPDVLVLLQGQSLSWVGWKQRLLSSCVYLYETDCGV